MSHIRGSLDEVVSVRRSHPKIPDPPFPRIPSSPTTLSRSQIASPQYGKQSIPQLSIVYIPAAFIRNSGLITDTVSVLGASYMVSNALAATSGHFWDALSKQRSEDWVLDGMIACSAVRWAATGGLQFFQKGDKGESDQSRSGKVKSGVKSRLLRWSK
jgi:hypothetical protein